MMKHLFLVAGTFLVMFVSSCGQKGSSSGSSNSQADSSQTTMPEIDGAIAGDLYLENFVATYKGTINNQYPITMEFIRFTSTIGGSYRYDGKTTSLKIKGSMEDTGEIRLAELNGEGEETGYFEGKMQGEQITGTWYNRKRTKSLPFAIERTHIASLQTKSDIMSDAIGTYSLQSIFGNAGANAMFDTYQEKGKWKSTSSGIVSYQREGHENELTQADIDLLNNLHIIVDDHMNVRVMIGLIELLNCPYKTDGMRYEVNETDKEKMNLKIAAINPSFSITNDHVDIMVSDHIDFSSTLKGNFDIIAENNVILSYYPAERKFELNIFSGICCDGNILQFERK